MIIYIAILFTLIVLIVTYVAVLFTFAWLKVKVFLTWNTRYEQAEYEQTITKPKIKRPHLTASKTEQHGRVIKPVDNLVNLEDMPPEDAMKAIESMAE